MKFAFFILLFGFFTFGLFGQSKQSGYYSFVEISYYSGFGLVIYDEDFKPAYSRNAYGLTGNFGYFIHPQLSLGLGTGLVGYHNPGHNTLPIYLDLHGYMNDR